MSKARFARAPLRLGTAGSAAIEFGLCAPLLLILLTGVVEIGRAMYGAMQAQSAVEAGMVYAAKNGWDATGIAAAVVNSTGSKAIAATPAPTQFCACPSATSLLTTSCSVMCADGSAPGQYIQINARLPRQTILPFPALPLPSTFTAKSILRLS